MEGVNTTVCNSLLLISVAAAGQITCWQRMASTVNVSARVSILWCKAILHTTQDREGEGDYEGVILEI